MIRADEDGADDAVGARENIPLRGITVRVLNGSVTLVKLGLLVTIFWLGKDEGGNELLVRGECGNALGDCDMDGIADGNTDGAPNDM